MQVQAQLNRIKELADNGSRQTRNSRIRRAVDAIVRDRGYNVYNNGYDNNGSSKLAVITRGQERAVESRVTHQGRVNTLNRAAAGSVG